MLTLLQDTDREEGVVWVNTSKRIRLHRWGWESFTIYTAYPYRGSTIYVAGRKLFTTHYTRHYMTHSADWSLHGIPSEAATNTLRGCCYYLNIRLHRWGWDS